MTILHGNLKPEKAYDSVICQIVDYVYDYEINSPTAWARAKACLLDSIGVAIESIHESAECRKLLGPVWPASAAVPNGFRVPGTEFQLDAVKGAFDFGTMIRYLDHSDAFPGAEWGHPSDNLGAILAVADILARGSRDKRKQFSDITSNDDKTDAPRMRHVLNALIKAYEIQGCFQIKNAFNKLGIDHVILVKIACTAVTAHLLALPKDTAKAAVSHAWMDGHPLRTYRQSPNAGPRKGWAAGEACKQAVHLALAARAGQPGAPTALTAPRWGFYDTLFRGDSFELPRPFGTWVVENVLYKVNTAEGHGMTAVEAALQISQDLRSSGFRELEKEISHIYIRTQAAAMTIIDKKDTLQNAADRDHCMRYMVAVVILKGEQITTEDYQSTSPWASDDRVECLRGKMSMYEDPQMTADYHDTAIRSVANGLTVSMKDGTQLNEYLVEFPQGHVRRNDTLDLVNRKAERNLSLAFSRERVTDIQSCFRDGSFDNIEVDQFVDMLWLGGNA